MPSEANQWPQSFPHIFENRVRRLARELRAPLVPVKTLHVIAHHRARYLAVRWNDHLERVALDLARLANRADRGDDRGL